MLTGHFLFLFYVFVGRDAGKTFEMPEKRGSGTESAHLAHGRQCVACVAAGVDEYLEFFHPVFVYVIIIAFFKILVEEKRKGVGRHVDEFREIGYFQFRIGVGTVVFHQLVEAREDAPAFFVAYAGGFVFFRCLGSLSLYRCIIRYRFLSESHERFAVAVEEHAGEGGDDIMSSG